MYFLIIHDHCRVESLLNHPNEHGSETEHIYNDSDGY